MNQEKKGQKFSSTRRIAFGFLFIIIIGTLILMLPVSSADGSVTNFIDALFTATTSVCVTGLTTVSTATHWSLFGKIVILILIQLGGLGTVSCMVAVMRLFHVRVGMKEKILIQESYNLDTIGGMEGIITRIFRGALGVEIIGAVLYSFFFIPKFGITKGIWYSVFYAVSAFCNAGMDILGDSNVMNYSTNLWLSMLTMGLIIVGGIGFIVWWDVKKVVSDSFKIKKIRGVLFKRLTLHSKVDITTTAILIAAGAALIFAMEYNNPETLGNMNFGGKILASTFESVTTRTAGFAGITQGTFRMHTYLIMLVLMIIGGSPMGTAGGLKTTTVAMMFFCVRGVIQGKKDTEAFDRKISSKNIRMGLTVIALGMTILLIEIIALSITEDFPALSIIYECFSAMATVGLSTGITPMLSTLGKIIIIILMFIGRIGPITVVMAFSMKGKNHESDTRELARKRIIVG